MTSNILPRVQIRTAISSQFKIAVHNYRLRPFDTGELPVINILPEIDPLQLSELSINFRESETFRVEAFIGRRSDDEDFALSVDTLYYEVLNKLKKLRVGLPCERVTVVSRAFLTDERGQVPFVVIRFIVKVEFDSE